MAQGRHRRGTPSQTLRILEGEDPQQFSPRASVSSQSSGSWAGSDSGSVSPLSQRRNSNRTTFPVLPVNGEHRYSNRTALPSIPTAVEYRSPSPTTTIPGAFPAITTETETSPLLPVSSRPQPARYKSGSTHTERSERTLVGSPQAEWLAPPVPLVPNDGSRRPGERMQLKLPRGILSRCSPTADDEIVSRVERVIGYRFRNQELVLEALETPGSGMVCVGASNRPVPNGNKALAELGKAAMELALMNQFYLLNIQKSEHPRMSKLIGKDNLATIGTNTKIESWVRPRQGLAPSHQRNWMQLIKDDARAVTGEKDPKRNIARAMEAILGAVHLDGGEVAVQMVMSELKLLIRDSRS